MLHPIFFLPTLYTDIDMSIFGMVIVLAFQICTLLMAFTASFSKGTQQYESWHEFPIDLLYKDVSSLDTKWRILASCPNSQYIGTLTVACYNATSHHHSTNSYEPIRFLQISQKRLINIHCKSLKHINQLALFGFRKNNGHDQINMKILWCSMTVHDKFHANERSACICEYICTQKKPKRTPLEIMH